MFYPKKFHKINTGTGTVKKLKIKKFPYLSTVSNTGTDFVKSSNRF